MSTPTPAYAVRETPPPVRSERALADLWSRAGGLAAPLVAQDGRRFRVDYPGRRSARAGPDFRDAVLRGEDGRRIVGDVELHLRAPDWYGHKHHADANYNGVVLHIVLTPKGEKRTRQQSGGTTPIVGLQGQIETLERAEHAPPPLAAGVENMSRDELARALADAGDQRFLARGAAFAMQLEREDPEQVLYRAMMDALGYSSNRKPFRALADRVPYSYLARLRSEPASSRLLALEAALCGASGLLPRVTPPQRRAELERVRALLPPLGRRPMSASDWRHFRVRPANHPVRRILGAARIIDRYLDDGLARGVQADVDDGSAAHLTRRLSAPPYVGASRARDLAVNVALPFLHAYAGAARDPERQAACLALYAGFPKLSENEITREAMRLLPDWAKTAVRGARRQQGLMAFYERMAAPPGPTRLAERWAAYHAMAGLRAA